jgi:transcriptional regulator with XRE-family HTH domain
MNQEELLNLIANIRKTRGIKRDDLEGKAGASIGGLLNVLSKRRGTIGLSYIIKILDALDLQIAIEDKDIVWGTDMNRLRMMPKKLYHGERIESREYIRLEGFEGRVDMFESIDDVLKFVPKPCDIYEIRPGKLKRKSFDLVDHPFGTVYSYYDHIPSDRVVSMVTYK